VNGDAIHPKEQLLVCQKKFWTITWTAQTSCFIIYNLRSFALFFLPVLRVFMIFDVAYTHGPMIFSH
jgi:hypothetical protein